MNFMIVTGLKLREFSMYRFLLRPEPRIVPKISLTNKFEYIRMKLIKFDISRDTIQAGK